MVRLVALHLFAACWDGMPAFPVIEETARALLWVDAHVAAAALFPRDAAQLTVLRGGRRAVPAVACPWIGRAPCRPRAKTARITRRS